MGKNLKVHISGILIMIFAVSAGILSPLQLQAVVLVSLFGFISLMFILLVLAAPILFKVKKCRFTSHLMSHMRWIGIYTFIFALIHVLLVLNFFFAWDIVTAMQDQYRFIGGIAFLILAAMAATSNDAAVRKIGRNWKRLHRLVYIALLLVIIHSFNIGQIFAKELWIKAAVAIIAVIIVVWKLYKRVKKKTSSPEPAQI